DVSYTGGIKFFALGGLVIGTLNTFVKPLMKLLSFPLMLMTVGLFTFVINAVIFWLTVVAINGISISDITVSVGSPWTYLIGAVVFGLTNWILHIVVHNK
ncbi:phage holin family protein, partial [Candidatus Peregrinibacteria bacterium]|nr:phage holin family protein [Candidatus Peregrinibacteria bacterium]